MAVAEHSQSGGFELRRLWTDRRYRSVLFQLFAMFGLIAVIVFIANNTIQNFRALGVNYGFGFLSQPSNYDINQHLIPYDSTSTHGRAAVVGLLNTLLVAVCGIVLATIFGFIFGIARLSNNWLISRIVTVYIEVARNVPLLLQILLWHAIIIQLPPAREAMSFSGTIFLSNRGLTIPAPVFEPGFRLVPLALVVAIAAAVIFAKWAKREQEKTGRIRPVFTISTLLVLGLPAIAYFVAGEPLSWTVPEMGRFNLRAPAIPWETSRALR